MSTISYRWKSGDSDQALEMVRVEGTNGHPYVFGDGKEARSVEVRDFWIATVPVTQALWMHVMGAEDSPSVGRGAQRPLENVSWDAIIRPGGFLHRINGSGLRTQMLAQASLGAAVFRLPSETEWEYAARGGPHWHGGLRYSGSNDIDRVAWYDRKGGDHTHAVAQKSLGSVSLSAYEHHQSSFADRSRYQLRCPHSAAMPSYRTPRATPAISSRGDVPGLRVCVVAHLLLGPLVTRGHRLPFSRHFRTLGRHRGSDAVAAPIVERQSYGVALHGLAASDFGIRSRIPCVHDSCRLADDAPLGIILRMREAPPHAWDQMKRMHLIEISDQGWCPQSIKDAVSDFCRFILDVTKTYQAAAPLLARALQETGTRRVLDLCSGAAGPWTWLQPLLREMDVDVAVCLTDKYPNIQAFERARRLTQQAITYHPEPVDATRVPGELSGFRTIFTAFHHLRPEQARAVLGDAVAKGEGIAVFEACQRSFLFLLPLLLLIPLRVLVTTPLIRPFRWSRLFWTYLVPVVPLVLLFDSLVSCLRIYSVQELRDLTVGLSRYRWDIGTVRTTKIPMPIPYLIGVPIENAD